MANIVLLDGGLGQETIHRSSKPASPLWSTAVLMDEPDVVKSVHSDFITAGARVVTAATYPITRPRLQMYGDETRFEELIGHALDTVMAARDDANAHHVRIGGALPPLVASYHPETTLPRSRLDELYAEMAGLMADQVDVFQCETMISLDEAVAATKAGAATGKPVWTALSIKDDASGELRSGESLAETIHAVNDAGAEAILINCSSPEATGAVMPFLAANTRYAGAYANGFVSVAPLRVAGTVDALSARRDLTPSAYADYILKWVDQGARIVGGCCEISPEHISVLAHRLTAAGHVIVSDFLPEPARQAS